jgi:hypothetical protein
MPPVQIGTDLSAEAADAATFIPEDPDELASVVRSLADREHLRGAVASLVMPLWGSMNK